MFGGRVRRRRSDEVETRAELIRIAADVYEEGDTKEDLRDKILAEARATSTDRPILRMLLEALLPLLIQWLTGALTKPPTG